MKAVPHTPLPSTLLRRAFFLAAGCPAFLLPASAGAATYATIDEAIARGDIEDVKRHLQKDPAALNGAPDAKLSPLHQAILRKQREIALLLIEKGADVGKTDTSA